MKSLMSKIIIWVGIGYFALVGNLNAHELSVCTIFKDEARYLDEWLEFHIKQGIDHFYLYDNGSTDDPEKTLQPYIDDGLVTLTKWHYDYENGSEFVAIQAKAYMDCIYQIKQTDNWCAFLDTDEFLFSPSEFTLKEILNCYTSFSSVLVYWKCYGTSNVTVPEGGKLLNYLTKRASDLHYFNSFKKCIVQPKYAVWCVDPHFFMCSPEKYLDMKNHTDTLRINHYWARDVDFFEKVKIARRIKWDLNYNLIIQIESEMNEVDDPILSSNTQ